MVRGLEKNVKHEKEKEREREMENNGVVRGWKENIMLEKRKNLIWAVEEGGK